MQGPHERKADMLTLRGLPANRRQRQKSAEAIVGRKRAASRDKGKRRMAHGKAEGPNVRMAKRLGSLSRSGNNGTTSENSRIERRPEAGGHAGGVERSDATNKDNADVIFF
jgi:hypothetical protein